MRKEALKMEDKSDEGATRILNDRAITVEDEGLIDEQVTFGGFKTWR